MIIYDSNGEIEHEYHPDDLGYTTFFGGSIPKTVPDITVIAWKEFTKEERIQRIDGRSKEIRHLDDEHDASSFIKVILICFIILVSTFLCQILGAPALQ